MKKYNVIEKPIHPLSHPYHYLMHRYWGRKPHNVVNTYIKHFTNHNEIILDPFMGSGVTIIESLKLGRRAIGFDLNPISWFIVKTTIEKIDLINFKEEFLKIIRDVESKISKLYFTICPNCKKKSLIENTIWKNDMPLRIKGKCQKCGVFKKDLEEDDKLLYDDIEKNFYKLIKKEQIWYPKDKILKYVKRSGKHHINELFSKRALISLGILLKRIEKIEEISIRELMLLCFSSLLSNVSSLIPGNLKKAIGRAGWVISKMYTPPIHTEKNVLLTFKQRFKVILKGKKELEDKLNSQNARIYNLSSEKLNQVKSESIDYIFTDPPYGENIPYFGCSMLWNSWLRFNVNYENEIIYDKYREKNYIDYERRMLNVMKECYRVLKTGKYLTLTFNNRNLMIWKILLRIYQESGFKLINVIHQKQAVTSGTQSLNWRSTLRGDFIYNFIKEKDLSKKQITIFSINQKSVKDFILQNVRKIIKDLRGATTAEIYEQLIPKLVNEGILESEGNIYKNIETIFKEEFIQQERRITVNGKERKEYIWKIKEV